MKSDQEYKQHYELMENQILLRSKEGTSLELRANHTIPVVIHIISPPGTPIGTGNNLTDQQVEAGLALLNDAFANRGAFQTTNGQDIGIQFCLARRTPDGQPTNGITRHESNLVADAACSPFGTNMDNEAAIKKIVAWDCKQYLNIWLVTDLYNADFGCSLAGFAYFPGAPCTLDGIVQESRYWTTVGGTTVTAHETGHYFGLYHTFQGGCKNDDCLVDGDRVCDTPPDGSNSFAPCNTNSCHTDSPDLPDDNSNYMDYSSCAPVHFTVGQRDRMRSGLELSRKTLLESNGCEPVANLDAGISVQIDNQCQTKICPILTIKNLGLVSISDLKMKLILDGAAPIIKSWSGLILTNESTEIKLDCLNGTPGNHSLTIVIETVNNQVDENIGNNTVILNDIIIKKPILVNFDVINISGLEYYFLNRSENFESCLWDFGDGHTSVDINPTNIYQQPGVYYVKLSVVNSCGDKNLYTDTIEIKTCLGQLRGRVQSLNNYFEPDEEICDIVKNGVLHLPKSLSETGYYWTYFSICDTICTGEGYTLRVRLKNGGSNGGIDAYDTSIEIVGEGDKAGINLMGSAWAIGYTSAWVGTTRLKSLPELVVPLSNWVTIEMKLSNGKLNYSYEGSNFFEMDYPGKICNIHNINLTFKGSGVVDWIQVLDNYGNLVYEENFDDCNNLTKSTPCPKRPVNALVSFLDKCTYPRIKIENLNNSNDALNVDVFPSVKTNSNKEYLLSSPGKYIFNLSRSCPLADSSFIVNIDPLLEDSVLIVEQPKCNGQKGKIVLTGISGISPYKYTINGKIQENGVFDNLEPGNYEVIVSDVNGCAITENFTINSGQTKIGLRADSARLNIDCIDTIPFIKCSTTPNDPNIYFQDEKHELNNHGFFTNLNPGSHFITARDEYGCASDTLKFTVNDLRKTYYTDLNYKICPNDTISVDGIPYYLPGLYQDTLQAITGCDSILLINVSEYVTPFAGKSVDNKGFCDNLDEVINLNQLIKDAKSGGTWTLLEGDADGFDLSKGTMHLLHKEAGSYQLKYKVEGENACVSDSVIVDFGVFNAPRTLSFQMDSVFTCLQPIVLSATTEVSPSRIGSVQWYSGNKLIQEGTSLIADISGYGSNYYRIHLTDVDGCEISTSKHIVVDPNIPYFAPNAFSPNADNTNDIFKLYFDDNVKTVKSFRVFDRWGALMCEQHDIDPHSAHFGWDGSHRGKPMDPGVYVWMAEVTGCDGRQLLLKGDVTIVK